MENQSDTLRTKKKPHGNGRIYFKFVLKQYIEYIIFCLKSLIKKLQFVKNPVFMKPLLKNKLNSANYIVDIFLNFQFILMTFLCGLH